MSGLHRLLAGELKPGVYRWETHRSRGNVHEAVMEAGMTFAHVDTTVAESRGDVLHILGIALAFPEHYGRNLDALADCLRDVPATVVLWDGAGHVAEEQPRSFEAVLAVLRDRAASGPPFSVLLRGVPELETLPDLG